MTNPSTVDPTPPNRALEAVPELHPYPPALRDDEREKLGHEPRVGLGVSGGGIRSATFALGLAQGLAREKLVSKVDVMSTVSGGGYFGAFLGHLLHRKQPEDAPPRRELADEVLADPDAAAIWFLRSNGRYLAPNGSGDLFTAAATVLRNWVSVLVVIGSVVLLGFTALALLRYGVLEQVPWLAPMVHDLPEWLSPWTLAMGGVLLAGTVPLAWAYWLIRDGGADEPASHGVARWAGLVAAALVAAGVAWWPVMEPDSWSPFSSATRMTAQAVVIIAVATMFWNLWITRGATPHTARRHRSEALARSLVLLMLIALVVVLDSVGLAITTQIDAEETVGAGIAAIIAWLVRSPLITLAGKLKDKKLRPVPAGLAVVVALAIVVGYFGGIAALPHIVFRAWDDDFAWRGLAAVAALGVVLTIIVLATSELWYFLNRSSMHALYEARLRRAYLGASNPARASEGSTRLPITEPHPQDGLKRWEYDPSQCGGPIHLINVCVNETVDGRSQLQQRDRKGMGMAVGPAGISVGVRHHARWTEENASLLDEDTITHEIRRDLWQGARRKSGAIAATAATAATAANVSSAAPVAQQVETFRVFPEGRFLPEDLEVGAWVAISGGAVSTGLGSRTSLAFSLLLGLFNVRLGYWWNSGVNVATRVGATTRSRMVELLGVLRTFLPMQFALLDEWFARFPGTSRKDWYLTDGGHFENLGGYELIRRSLPLIVLCDAEADESYTFAGLANLVRKARTDFGAEVRFLGDEQILAMRAALPSLPACVGSLDALRRGRRETDGAKEPGTQRERVVVAPESASLSLAHAALAEVKYRSGARGWLIYMKPTLIGDEPTDVLEYHEAHPAFPHESTGDQFFDEAQWESYRRLGEHIAQDVFGGTSPLAEQLRGKAALPALPTA